jgi:molybdopterin-containing oxidoreductase family membrane subunit
VIGVASLLVILGGLVQMYVILIGGQAYPLVLFPGKEVIEGGFFEGSVATYIPSPWEFLLGIGGFAIALLLVAIAVKVLRFLPENLDDAHADPHHGAEKAH